MANLLSFFTFSLLVLSSYSANNNDCILPPKYFINCGSDTSIIIGATSFSDDRNNIFRHSTSLKDPNSKGSDSIYSTARVFTQLDGYELKTEETEENMGKQGKTEENRVYMVKLHFYPFVSPQYNLFNATFDVSASGFLLLSNFSVPKDQTLPVIKEFLLPVSASSDLIISFRPSHESPIAFINAIEAFITPQAFIPDSATPVKYQENSKMNGNASLSSNAFAVIHRINVGGSLVTPENDTMRRTWLPDDDYLFFNGSAKNHSVPSYSLNYVSKDSGGASRCDAPESVYGTAEEMNIVEERKANFFNITWLFGVKKNATFFVRLHFCDIISQTRNETFFNVYIYGLFGQPIIPYDRVDQQLVAPFYVDFVVDSDGSGFMNISVGPRRDSQNQNAFLNGVEIMELINERGIVQEENGQTKKRLLKIVVSSVGGGVVLVFVSALVILFCLRSRKEQSVKNVDRPVVNVYGGSSHAKTTERTPRGSTTPDMSLGLKIPLTEILYATNNFDPKSMIGEGGFGKVYKGTFRDGVKLAVKRSEPGHGQGLMEFETEITVLSKIHHQHLVSLIGYCNEQNEMILVYEFMEKGTLREHLYSSNEDLGKSFSHSELSWDQRLEICIGAAKGLHYLHTGLNDSIIHRDIKSTNILLDDHYVAKVADFGLSKSGPLDQTHISTGVKGTFGYLDPEYFSCMQLTQKSDVYSFGVLLLEVLCARPALDKQLPRDQINLAEWGLSWQKENQLEKIIDPLLAGKINPNSLRKFGGTVEKCLQESGTDRPNMVDVLWDLEYALKLQHSAMPQEPHEDSTTDVSWQLGLSGLHRLPSLGVTTSYVNDTEVFSQLGMDDAR